MAYKRPRYTARLAAVPAQYDAGFTKAELQRIEQGIPAPTVVDLRDFTVPEGSRGGTDYSSNVQKAVNQAKTAGASPAVGATIFAPPGIIGLGYAVDPNRTGNVTFQGAGREATEFLALGADSAFSNFPAPDVAPPWTDPATEWMGTNLGFRDLSVNMNYDVVPDNGVLHPARGTSHVYQADDFQYAFFFSYFDGVWFENVLAKNSWFNGFELYGCRRVRADARTLAQHCGDKKNYLNANYSGLELDAFTRGAEIDMACEDCGNGFVINAANANASPDGILGATGIRIGGSVTNSVMQGVAAQGRIDGLTITTTVRTTGTYGIAITNPESATEGSKGARNVKIDATITDYNQLADSGSPVYTPAIDVTAANSQITARISNSSTGTAGTRDAVATRQLSETVSGSPVLTGGMQVTGVTVRASLAGGYAVRALGTYTRVDTVTLHDTSGLAAGGVLNAATGSTTGSVTTIP